jgi:hypothetical protein
MTWRANATDFELLPVGDHLDLLCRLSGRFHEQELFAVLCDRVLVVTGVGPISDGSKNGLRPAARVSQEYAVPLCSDSGYPCGEELTPVFDSNSNPISSPENDAVETARAISPRNARGSVGATAAPIPRPTAGSVASYSTRTSTRPGVSFGPKN